MKKNIQCNSSLSWVIRSVIISFFSSEVTSFMWNAPLGYEKKNKTPACWEGNALCDTNFPLRREVPSRNRYHIFPQYASLRTGSTSWHEREINQSKTHPSTFTKAHTCARLHTTVRSVAFISQNKVSLRSRGLKKEQNDNNRNYIWCLIVGKTHQHAGVGTAAWQIRRRFG